MVIENEIGLDEFRLPPKNHFATPKVNYKNIRGQRSPPGPPFSKWPPPRLKHLRSKKFYSA